LERIVKSLGCGSLYFKRTWFDLQVAGLSTITSKIVPFFTSHPLSGAKALDFRDFCKGISLMNLGGHLTEAGLAQLKSLYLSMNSNRTHSVRELHYPDGASDLYRLWRKPLGLLNLKIMPGIKYNYMLENFKIISRFFIISETTEYRIPKE
jgi:LAGLIDADG endonuclease